MPREQINHPSTSARNPAAVSLHWSQDEHDPHVSISMAIPFAEMAKIVDEIRADEKKGAEPPQSLTYFTPALERRDLNRLITAARRARNHAFGADE